MGSVSLVFISAVAIYTAAAAAVDFRKHRIPNYLTVPTALLGLAYHSFAPFGFGVTSALAGFTLGFLLLLLPWCLGGGGMGDVKLLAALGSWLGPQWLLIAFAASIFFAAVMSICVLIYTAFLRGVGAARHRLEISRSKQNSTRFQRKSVLPFAVPVAAGTWILLAWIVVQQSW